MKGIILQGRALDSNDDENPSGHIIPHLDGLLP